MIMGHSEYHPTHHHLFHKVFFNCPMSTLPDLVDISTIASQFDTYAPNTVCRAISLAVAIVSSGLILLGCRYPCLTLVSLERSFNKARDALGRCRDEEIPAVVWGSHELDLWSPIPIPIPATSSISILIFSIISLVRVGRFQLENQIIEMP
ncbi:hypothetical protein D9758_014728 [Tetrapyrgos nigripes]|uniref:Uncharacterized protein n=1 Tax=Tetrapyrgos nigripes TaxID=182062 RepID=A0A8H5CAC6_9AGAR|nr:hypothetical protein D9758_014728 [Tetrapyrgos nigripes]